MHHRHRSSLKALGFLAALTIAIAAAGDAFTAPAAASTTPPPAMKAHKPYAANKCKSCHELAPDKSVIPDKFTSAQPEMCYECHDSKTEKRVVHKALEESNCTDCHSPHESPNRALLLDKVKPLCSQCHKAQSGNQPFTHSALVMRNSCVECHEPHSSDNKKLLKGKASDLCLRCHQDMKQKMDDPRMNLHEALGMGCQKCHDAHGSKNDKLLLKPTNELCYTCHEQESYEDHPRRGHPVTGRPDPVHPERPLSCVSCHKPHYSANDHLFRYDFRKGVTPYDGTICSVCHWQTVLPPPGPPKPPWND